jgi:hypothetical protein
MGRSYYFECSKCGYRATVAGRADGGVSFEVQTITCRDCKELLDVVTRLKEEPPNGVGKSAGANRGKRMIRPLEAAPRFEVVLNRLPAGAKRLRWVPYEICCPVSPLHRVQAWNDPGRCPRCGTYLDKSALPFRIWE